MNRVFQLCCISFLSLSLSIGCTSSGKNSGVGQIEILDGESSHEKLQKDCQLLQEIQASAANQSQALTEFKKEATAAGATHGFIFSDGEEEPYIEKSQFDFYENSSTLYGEAFKCG